eukprot:763627-Hanusia_phi.AAC.6
MIGMSQKEVTGSDNETSPLILLRLPPLLSSPLLSSPLLPCLLTALLQLESIIKIRRSAVILELQRATDVGPDKSFYVHMARVLLCGRPLTRWQRVDPETKLLDVSLPVIRKDKPVPEPRRDTKDDDTRREIAGSRAASMLEQEDERCRRVVDPREGGDAADEQVADCAPPASLMRTRRHVELLESNNADVKQEERKLSTKISRHAAEARLLLLMVVQAFSRH